MAKKKIEETPVIIEANASVNKILPLEHADFNTIKEKINEIINHLNV